MSAGTFITAFYETDGGSIGRCQVQPETLDLVIGGTENVSSSGPGDLPIDIRMNGKANRFSIRARYVTVEWGGAPPAGYDPEGLLRLPVLLPATYSAYIAAGRGATGTYLGAGIVLVRWTAENA